MKLKELRKEVVNVGQSSILVIEDERDILELVQFNLERSGYLVFGATSGAESIEILSEEMVDLIILDLMLPDVSGLKMCDEFKRSPKLQHIPIIMLTAKSEEYDIVKGLESGADDYITKPFSTKVLVARAKSVLRRTKLLDSFDSPILMFHDLQVNHTIHEVFLKNEKITLTLTEYNILTYLLRNTGIVHTRKQILDAVKGYNTYLEERNIDVHINSIRKKIGDLGRFIETVRGIGYRLKDDV